jgi:hypothetical protein
MSIQISALESDLEQLSQSLNSGQPISADLKRRIQARSEAIRDQRIRQQGLLNHSVTVIREIRDE